MSLVVACYISPVTCHLLLTPTARATDSPPGKSFIMVLSQTRVMPIFVLHSFTISLQSTEKRVVCDGTYRHTNKQLAEKLQLTDWIGPVGRFSERPFKTQSYVKHRVVSILIKWNKDANLQRLVFVDIIINKIKILGSSCYRVSWQMYCSNRTFRMQRDFTRVFRLRRYSR